MDGLFDDSSWPRMIKIIDGADRILYEEPRLLLALVLISLYYALMGSWLELVLTTIVIGSEHSRALLTFACYFWEILSIGLIPTVGIVTTGFMLTSYFANRDEDWDSPAQPYLIPCKTTHTRLFPKKHSFAYSYLVVGVPVGSTGTANGMLAIDDRSYSAWSFICKLFRGRWYSVSDADYMQRGRSAHGLRGKLDEYLRSQDVKPSDYPHAYLVTAARFLGYHFNPVSFWYLYSVDKILSAIVLEVNNTFDERRPYLVLRDFSSDARHVSSPSQQIPSSRIRGSWSKDFHVSPFNSRKGAYSLIASDPFGPGMKEFRGINVTINLSSSKGHTKLVTRLLSEGEAVNPASMGPVARVKFLSRWFWVGFATFPRIVKEAAALFFKRKLHVWYRPEPMKASLGRHATKTEGQLEVAFREYLKFLVNRCHKPMSITYVASGIVSNPEDIFRSPSWYGSLEEDRKALELKVLTPIFYTRFVHYAHDFEAIFTEFMDSATIWVSEPKLLPDLFLKKGSPPLQTSSMMDYLFLKGIKNLRRRPNNIPRVSTSADIQRNGVSTVDIRDFRISPMDAYILELNDNPMKATYRSTLLRMFVADRWLLGNAALLDLGILLLRAGLALACATTLNQAMTYLR
ncbi:hypothetical protein NOR_02804 [Metarhizium rileyi]|uniref:DNA-binding WRKY domain-containing protein n=1 Tax=Metarhizium rileyi (strain RCEF 4871) TaxID=1649241 RepID=A0A167G232_METRR|nr:hypothetical protein NOR_02804 [Metarhizium rileyi RCEF 4871]